jgi:hypothetical protein
MALGFSVVEEKRRAARFHHTALAAPNALVLVGEDVRREYKTSPILQLTCLTQTHRNVGNW